MNLGCTMSDLETSEKKAKKASEIAQSAALTFSILSAVFSCLAVWALVGWGAMCLMLAAIFVGLTLWTLRDARRAIKQEATVQTVEVPRGHDS